MSIGELGIAATPAPGGGASIRWDGHEYDPVTCVIMGPDIGGSESIEGPCCEKVVDIYFPAKAYYLRAAIRTDWQAAR